MKAAVLYIYFEYRMPGIDCSLKHDMLRINFSFMGYVQSAGLISKPNKRLLYLMKRCKTTYL